MLTLTYEELALRLREHGFEETKASALPMFVVAGDAERSIFSRRAQSL